MVAPTSAGNLFKDFPNNMATQNFFGLPLIPLLFLGVGIAVILLALLLRDKVSTKIATAVADLTGKSGLATDQEIIDSIKPAISFSILLVAAWVAITVIHWLEKPFTVRHAVDVSMQITIVLIWWWVLLRVTNAFLEGIKKKALAYRYGIDAHLIPTIGITLKALIFVGMFAVIAHILGYSVGAIIASLGLGGVAVALAAKDTLANFFGSIAIMADKPFGIGDWIKGTDFDGTVEEIGFRSTKIRTQDKTVIIVPNDKLASMPIENLDRRKDHGFNVRRVHFTLGVSYGVGAEQVERAVKEIERFLRSSLAVSNEWLMVYLNEFGDSSITIVVNYFIKEATDNEAFFVRRQEINLEIMRIMEKLGLPLTPKTQTVALIKPD
jgi:MscS family membrane protein